MRTPRPAELASRVMGNQRAQRAMARMMASVLQQMPSATRRECVDGMMPKCLDAMFAGVSAEQGRELAAAMRHNIDAASRRLSA